jgi:SAM-dependent methyltransferase
LFTTKFPKDWSLACDDGRIHGLWWLGEAQASNPTYYGSYPAGYLQRAMSLFPDAERILHVFSGSLPKGNYVRFDAKAAAEVNGDAHYLSQYFKSLTFDLVLADPPYGVEDSQRYGLPMVKRGVVLNEVAKVLEPGGFLVWLDRLRPVTPPGLEQAGVVGVIWAANSPFRMATIFQRASSPSKPRGVRSTGLGGGDHGSR